MNWVPDSERPCGRPTRCWLKVIEKDLKEIDQNLDLKTAELIAQNRAQYRQKLNKMMYNLIDLLSLADHLGNIFFRLI